MPQITYAKTTLDEACVHWQLSAVGLIIAGRVDHGLRSAQEEESEDDNPKISGAQQEEEGSDDEEKSDTGGIEGTEVERDAEEDVEYPVVENELDTYMKGVSSLFHNDVY